MGRIAPDRTEALRTGRLRRLEPDFETDVVRPVSDRAQVRERRRVLRLLPISAWQRPEVMVPAAARVRDDSVPRYGSGHCHAAVLSGSPLLELLPSGFAGRVGVQCPQCGGVSLLTVTASRDGNR